MAIQDKVNAVEFSIATSLPLPAIEAAVGQATTDAKRTMGTSVRCQLSNELGYEFRVMGPGGIVEMATFLLHWEAPVDGVRTVVMNVTDYTVTRETLAYIIPIGPKLAPALWSLKKFSASMQAALRAA